MDVIEHEERKDIGRQTIEPLCIGSEEKNGRFSTGFSKPHHVGGIVSSEENHRRGTISRNTGTQATLGASVNGYRACLDTGYRGSLTAAGNHSSLLFVSGKRVERELSADHVNDHRQRTLAVS